MKPDTVLIALTFADDTVGIMAFVLNEYRGDRPTWSRPPTPENIDAEITKASTSFDEAKVPVKSWRLVALEEIPTDRTFRNALRDSGGKLEHDMGHARAIHRDRIREARAHRMAELDIAYMVASETGHPGSAVLEGLRAEKQQLRDAPADPAIDAATTTDELKAVWPSRLKRLG